MTARDLDRSVGYRVEVSGLLDDHWSDWLGGVALHRNPSRATTTLISDDVDQARLHGLLAGIRDIGAALVSLRQVGEPVAPTLGSVLHTERLVLRPATCHDADPTWAYRRLASVGEWLTGGSDTQEEYRELFTDPARLAATVILETGPTGPDPGRLVGDFMLRRDDAWSQPEVAARAAGAQVELGWTLDPAHTGVGYATEAVRELLRHCFEDLGVHRVVAESFAENVASWRLMERVGMRRETLAVQESLHRSGRWLDTVGYAILAEEWVARSVTGG